MRRATLDQFLNAVPNLRQEASAEIGIGQLVILEPDVSNGR